MQADCSADVEEVGLLSVKERDARPLTRDQVFLRLKSHLHDQGAEQCDVNLPEAISKQQNSLGLYPESFFQYVAVNETHVKPSHVEPASLLCAAKHQHATAFFVVGDCFRAENDITHLSEFQQLDITALHKDCTVNATARFANFASHILKRLLQTPVDFVKDDLAGTVDGGLEIIVKGVEVGSGGPLTPTSYAKHFGAGNQGCGTVWSFGLERLAMAANGFDDIHKVT